jgi:hypothetical protein
VSSGEWRVTRKEERIREEDWNAPIRSGQEPTEGGGQGALQSKYHDPG